MPTNLGLAWEIAPISASVATLNIAQSATGIISEIASLLIAAEKSNILPSFTGSRGQVFFPYISLSPSNMGFLDRCMEVASTSAITSVCVCNAYFQPCSLSSVWLFTNSLASRFVYPRSRATAGVASCVYLVLVLASTRYRALVCCCQRQR